MEHNSQYTYFWSGPFSQWVKSDLVIDDKQFCTAEQYMMWSKAMLFEDYDIAEAVLKTRDPKKQKALGRQVRNFDADQWADVAFDVVYSANFAKFTQNKSLYEALMDTVGTVIVEASPYDAIWGIGLNEATARATDPKDWPGKNLLGIILTKLREELVEHPPTFS